MTRTTLTLVAALLAACGQPETPPEPGAPEAPPSAPARGGVLATLGPHVLELVVHATGELHAHVRTHASLADGALTVTLPDEAGERHTVAMRWADGVQGFVGQMEGAPAPGEATLLLVVDGHRETATVDVEGVLPAPEHHGSILAVGDHTVEVVVEPGGDAHVYVLDDPDHRLDLDLTLNIGGDDGHLHPLPLVWDEESGHYVGHIEGMHPTPGPLEVIADEDGRELLGRGSLLDVAALERPGALGHDVPGDFRLEMPSLGSDVPAVVAVPPADEGDTDE